METTTIDIAEVIALAWSAWMDAPGACSTADIAMATGLLEHQVRLALAALRDNELVVADGDGRWIGRRRLTTALWARAVRLGIPVVVLERRAVLQAAGHDTRVRGLDAAERHASDCRARRRARRAEWARGRAASHLARKEMVRLTQDAREAMASAASPAVMAVLARLIQTNEQVLDRLRQRLERE